PGMVGMMENVFINNKGKSYTMTADVELSNDKTNGVIIAQAGRFGGWSLYMKDGKVHHVYNFFGLEQTNISSAKALAPGKHAIKYQFDYDGGKPGSGGNCILYVDGQKVAEGRIPKTQPFTFSADEGVDVGMDSETVVTDDYKQGANSFTGTIYQIKVDTEPQK
ncbi:MAG TPA: hypothetical protein VFV79_01040, partial [Saprospiraceae bacterium]|nr:hypothetical protein [Saprospiraceae bacterium]